MTETRVRDAMICRACGREERASEGYPCDNCGTFVCQICTMRGVTMCRTCAEAASAFGAPTMEAPAQEGEAPPNTAEIPTWLQD